jgi:O-methyltransferase involved in polyketide biosynthesis
VVLNEGLLIYLTPEEQKKYFSKLKELQKNL